MPKALRRPVEKILLLFPPIRLHREGIKQALPPWGAASLAAVVRDRCQVAILDAVAEGFFEERSSDHGFFVYGLPLPELERRIASFKPDLVGITCLFSSVFPVVRDLCRMIKKTMPSTMTVCGGTHPTFLPRQCLESAPELDLIAQGEGEPVLLDLLDALRDGRELESVDGLAFRQQESGEIRINPKTRLVDLDRLPLPARDLLPWELYQRIRVPHLLFSPGRRFATVITSRGCPARCTFCSSWKFWGGRFRTRSAENVLDELELLKRDFGTEEIQFEDDAINLNPGRFKEILRGMIERRLNLSWSAPNGMALWTLDEESIALMKESGCHEVTLAIESGSQEVLDRIVRKPLKLERVRPLVKELKRAGIRTSSFFIVGFPEETREQMRQTFSLPSRVGLEYAWFFIANPLPGTALYELCREKGYLEDGFAFENNSFSRCHIRTPAWGAKEVERLAHRAFLKFNLMSSFRHPWSLYRRYRYFLKNPRLLAEIGKSLLRRNLPGLGYRRGKT